MAQATQRPNGNGKQRDAGMGPVSVWGEGEWDMGWEGRPIVPSIGSLGLGNQSPWSGEPWANHGEPGHRKSGKCPELGDGREVSAGVRVDPEVPVKVLPWVDVGAGGLGAGKTSGAGTRGVSLDVVIGVGTRDTDTNGGESSDNRSKVHADCGPAENPSL